MTATNAPLPDDLYDLADGVEWTMERWHRVDSWTASSVHAKLPTVARQRWDVHQVRTVLDYLVRQQYMVKDDRGARTRYGLVKWRRDNAARQLPLGRWQVPAAR